MVILHTEICKKKEKLEKNYLHLYLTIFLNIILMLTSETRCVHPQKLEPTNIFQKKNFHLARYTRTRPLS